MKEITLDRPAWMKPDYEWPAVEVVFEIDDNLSGRALDELKSLAHTHAFLCSRAARDQRVQYELNEFAELMPKFFEAAKKALRGMKVAETGKTIPGEKIQDVLDALDMYAREILCLEIVAANERDLKNVLGSLSSLS